MPIPNDQGPKKPQAPRPSSVTHVESVFHLGRRFGNWTLEPGTSLEFGPLDLDIVRRFLAWSLKLRPSTREPVAQIVNRKWSIVNSVGVSSSRTAKRFLLLM